MATLATRLTLIERGPGAARPDYPVTFTPNAGPQTDALHAEAEETFYGGSAGSGKSFLLLGLAFTQHRRSMIYRRHYDELEELIDKSVELVGTRTYFNGSSHRWTLPG